MGHEAHHNDLAAEESRLVPLSLGFPRHERDVFILTRRDLAKLPRIRAVTDYLAALFRREKVRLEGRLSSASPVDKKRELPQ
jgi:DNA-binding transcriptional LysR family regulator